MAAAAEAGSDAELHISVRSPDPSQPLAASTRIVVLVPGDCHSKQSSPADRPQITVRCPLICCAPLQLARSRPRAPAQDHLHSPLSLRRPAAHRQHWLFSSSHRSSIPSLSKPPVRTFRAMDSQADFLASSAPSTSGRGDASDIELLKQAVLNEKASPEILQFQTDLVSRVEAHIDYQARRERAMGCPSLIAALPPPPLSRWRCLTPRAGRSPMISAGRANRDDARK